MSSFQTRWPRSTGWFLPREIIHSLCLEKSLVRDKGGNILDWNKAYLPDNFVHGDLVASGLAKDLGQTGNSTYYQLSDKLAAFERANMQLNNANVVARNNLNAAWGLSKRLPQDILYTPPVNVSQAKHFAYVKLREGTGMGDDAVRVITAKSKQDLESSHCFYPRRRS
jgi:hypothetical protein